MSPGEEPRMQVSTDTIRAWHRKLISREWDCSGRPYPQGFIRCPEPRADRYPIDWIHTEPGFD